MDFDPLSIMAVQTPGRASCKGIPHQRLFAQIGEAADHAHMHAPDHLGTANDEKWIGYSTKYA